MYFGFSHFWKFSFNFLFIAKRIQKWIMCLIIRNKWYLVNYLLLKLSVQNLEPYPIPYPSMVLQPHITGIWAIIDPGKYQREDFYETAKDFLMNFVASFKSRLEDENEASLQTMNLFFLRSFIFYNFHLIARCREMHALYINFYFFIFYYFNCIFSMQNQKLDRVWRYMNWWGRNSNQK